MNDKMYVTRVATDNGSKVEPPFNHGWNDISKLRWVAAVAEYDSGLDVTVDVAEVRRRVLFIWKTLEGLYNVRCGGTSCGPFLYNEAESFINALVVGAREAWRLDE